MRAHLHFENAFGFAATTDLDDRLQFHAHRAVVGCEKRIDLVGARGFKFVFDEMTAPDWFRPVAEVPHHLFAFLETANLKSPRASFSFSVANSIWAIVLPSLLDAKCRVPIPFFSCWSKLQNLNKIRLEQLQPNGFRADFVATEDNAVAAWSEAKLRRQPGGCHLPYTFRFHRTISVRDGEVHGNCIAFIRLVHYPKFEGNAFLRPCSQGEEQPSGCYSDAEENAHCIGDWFEGKTPKPSCWLLMP